MMIVVKQHDQIIYDVNILDEDLRNGVEILIGREEDCHVQLDSHLISRYHARVNLEGNEGLVLETTSDYGGVLRNGAPVQKTPLIENDKITINEFELVLSQIPIEKAAPQNELPIDEAFSKTEMFEKINEETVQIPAELEEMMGEELSPDLDDSDSTEMLQDIEEDFNEMPIEAPMDEFESSLEDDSLENDFSDDGLGDDLENKDLAGEGIEDSLDSIDSEPIEETNNEFNSDFNSDQTEADFNTADADDSFNQDGFGEEGFSDGMDDGLSDSGFGGDDSGATQVFQSFAKFSLKIFGEYAPFDSFLIDEEETRIGRDTEKCQIPLNDPEVSKIHAIIQKEKNSCVIVDNDSSNGIIHNGERVKRAELFNGDEFVIGDTSFTVLVKSDIIEAERGVLMPVPEGQEVEIEEVVEEEVDFDEFEGGDFGAEEQEEKSIIKRIWKDKRKRMYAIVGILVLGLLLIDDEPSKTTAVQNPKEEKKEEKPEDNTQYSKETLEKLEQNYQLALARFGENQFSEAKLYIDIVNAVDPNFSQAASLTKAIDEALAEQKRREEEKARAEEELRKQIEIKALVEKATKATNDRNVELAQGLFSKILKLDPENLDVPPLKLDLDVWKAEEQRKIEEAARKKALRQAMLGKLKPGKTAYIQESWFEAAEKLERFIQTPDIDEDLLKEASSMLKDSKQRLTNMINPLLSKARSFKEGQDLKQSYETYGEVLKLDPTNEEALNERDAIFNELNNRSKKVYREALVAESLSLFPKAKEKFQEVQQISPINSEYYNKATDKLKNYLE